MSNSSYCNSDSSLGHLDRSGNQSHSQTSFENQHFSYQSTPTLDGARSLGSMSQGSTMSSHRSLEQMNESKGRPYVSTMMARQHIRPPSVPPSSQRDQKILQGDLYQQLITKGATEEVAYERQRMFYLLNGIVSNL